VTGDVWLVEVTGYTAAAVSTVYRYATGPYITTAADTPASTWYDERVIDPGTISRQIFAGGVSGGQPNPRSETGYGAIALANLDGALDAVFDSASISFRERQVRVLRVRQGAAYSTAVLVLSAVVSQIEMSADRVTIGIKDRTYELDSPHLTATYGGTNALPAGVDGVADLAGKVKPLALGSVAKIEPPCCNTSRLIYQVSTAAIQSGTVYDGGVALTAGANYADQAAMEATAPAAGQVRWWLAGGMFRLGSSPVYTITADVVADTAPNSTAAQLIKRLALERGIASGDVNAADVTALDTANSAVLGLWVNDSSSTTDLLDRLAASVGAWWGFDRAGVLRMARFDAPSGTSAAMLATWNVSAVERVANGEDVPTTTVRLRHSRYHRTQSPTELAGAVTDAQVSDLAQEWRTSSATTTLSPNPHKRTLTAERDTALTQASDAATEATRVLGLVSTARRTHIARDAQLDDAALQAVDLGAVVALRWPRYGFDNSTGTLRRVLAIHYSLARGACDLTLWG